MIPVRDAVNSAVTYLKEFSDLMPSNDIQLEETVFDESDNVWRITLSLREIPISPIRKNKMISIDGLKGNVISMVNRV